MRAIIDGDTCIGCTLCVEDCSEAFKMENDKAIVYVDIVPKEAEENCKKASENCPVDAITIEKW